MKLYIFIIFTFSIIIFFPNNKIIKYELNGEILTINPEQGSYGLVIIEMKNKSVKNLNVDGISGKFSDDHTKIFVQHYYSIDVYDIVTENVKTIYKSDFYIEYFELLDNNRLLLKASKDRNLILYDIKKKNTKIIKDNVFGHFSCNENKLYYSDAYQNIYEYDIDNNVEKYIIKGNSPIISPDNNYIAYKDYDEGEFLFILDLKTKKISKFYDVNIAYYCFSPDSDYIAYVAYSNSLKYLDRYAIKTFSIKGNKKGVFYDIIPNENSGNIDWR